ncbi:MAG: hypothetical protein H8E17_05895 [Deltaproteobacteria bacterium]|nr:hypothetical protein [Deltaproteobacteria bacterium]
MENREPEDIVRDVIKTCVNCDFCEFHMQESPCLLFPELYRLYQKERNTGEKTNSYELRCLVDLCNGCAICPCDIIRSEIRKAKNAFILRDGLKSSTWFLERVELIGRLSGVFPTACNRLLRNPWTRKVIKHSLGIHEKRRFPLFKKENFNKWLRRKGRHFRPDGPRRKVAYFAGCTGQYLFPGVPKAVVKVLMHNHIEVLVPEQRCCGMPPLLEGDRILTLRLVAENVERLYEAVEDDWDIVCSCPTCGYMLKELWKNEDYFAPISRRKRIRIASRTFDLGEYLARLHEQGEIDTAFAPVSTDTVYFPPCHLRAQNIGEPYVVLLEGIPQLGIKKIAGPFNCCGAAGIIGFKREFHAVSIKMGQSLMSSIGKMHPEQILTDCLSCRLQFQEILPYPVWHPVEILERAYGL